MTKPFRFGLGMSSAESATEFVAAARMAEDQGYSVLLVPDHLGAFSPAVTVTAAAAATSTLRVGSFVLNNDFRHPTIVAQEAATIDILTDGRYELGIGAGWNKPEYDAAGIEYHTASVRIARMEESISILRRLFAGETVSHRGEHYTITDHPLEPRPLQGAALPILVGGNGDKVLTVAARHADIVGFTGFTFVKGVAQMTHFSTSELRDRIDFVRTQAGQRFADIELNVLIQRAVITNARRAAAEEFAANWGDDAPPIDDMLDSPFVLFGTADQIADQILGIREALGISYWVAARTRAEGFEAVVARLAGR